MSGGPAMRRRLSNLTIAPGRASATPPGRPAPSHLRWARPRSETDNARSARALLFVIGLYSAIVSPLAAADQATTSVNADAVNWINQAIWLSFAAAAVVILLLNPARFPTARFLRSHVFMLGLMAWFAVSAAWSLSPEATIRRVALQLIIMTAVAICVMLVREAKTIFNDMLYLLFVTVIVNWLAFVVLPPTPLGHAGIYLSKNNFGTFAAMMVLLGASRVGTGTPIMRLMAAFVVASGFVFLIVSAAKTSIGLALLVPAISIFLLKVPLFRPVNAVLVGLLGVVLLACAVAIVTSLSLTTDDVFTLLFGDPTFTGRTSIWDFTWSYIEKRPWLGYGFGGSGSVKRHQRRRNAGYPHDVRAPAVLRNGCDLDEIVASRNGFSEAMNDVCHVCVGKPVWAGSRMHFTPPLPLIKRSDVRNRAHNSAPRKFRTRSLKKNLNVDQCTGNAPIVHRFSTPEDGAGAFA